MTIAALISVPPAVSASEATKSHHVVKFFQKHSWLRAPNQPNCKAVPWTRSCRIARRVYVKHVQKLALLKRTLPATNDWRTSVRIAQRPFPGTASWLLFISDREGGYGPFVMNRQGSGAGGWMQFMASTFYAYVDDARAAVERRGFIVPANVWTWTHPLGQALTAGYMRYTGRDGCHWCL